MDVNYARNLFHNFHFIGPLTNGELILSDVPPASLQHARDHHLRGDQGGDLNSRSGTDPRSSTTCHWQSKPGTNVIKHFTTVSYEFSKARSLSQSGAPKRCLIVDWKGLPGREKCCSLFKKFVIYDRKKFYNIGSREFWSRTRRRRRSSPATRFR